jgi:hypothetical protein
MHFRSFDLSYNTIYYLMIAQVNDDIAHIHFNTCANLPQTGEVTLK